MKSYYAITVCISLAIILAAALVPIVMWASEMIWDAGIHGLGHILTTLLVGAGVFAVIAALFAVAKKISEKDMK